MLNEANILSIIDQLGNDLATNLKRNLPKASGSTADDVLVTSGKENGRLFVEITGPSHIFNLVEGRGPTQRPGTGQVLKSIRLWIDQRNITPRPKDGKEITKESLAYAIATHIHETGFPPIVPDLFEKSFDQNQINMVEDIILDEIARATITIFNNFEREVAA